MIQSSFLRVFAVSVLVVWSVAWDVVADDLVVEKGSPLEIGGEGPVTNEYGQVTLHDDLTIHAGSMLKIADNADQEVFNLAPDQGDEVVVTCKPDQGQIHMKAGSGGCLKVGKNGGWGTMIFENWDSQWSNRDCFRMRYVEISEKAAVPDGTPAFMTIGNRRGFHLRQFRNYSDKPVKIVFDGGYMSSTDGNDNRWFATFTETGTITLEGVNGRPVRFANAGHSRKFFTDNVNHRGMVIVAGDCDFVVEGTTPANNETFIIDQTNVCFRNTGNLCAIEKLKVTVNDVLPVGELTGNIALSNHTTSASQRLYAHLDLCGCTNAVNGLYQARVADEDFDRFYVTNSHATIKSVLRLGTAKDGRFNAKVSDDVVIEQVGHVITLDKAVMPEYKLLDGTLRVTRDSEITTLRCGLNTAVIVDGATLKVDMLIDNGASYQCVNGGKLEVRSGGSPTVNDSGFTCALSGSRFLDGAGTFVKAGDDSLVVNQTDVFPFDLEVKAGTLMFVGGDGNTGCTNEWWRWTIRGTQAANGYGRPNVAAIGLFSPTDNEDKWKPFTTTLGIKPAEPGTDVKELPLNRVYIPETIKLEPKEASNNKDIYCTGLTNLLNGASRNLYFQTETLMPHPTDPATWIPITFRIQSSNVVGFSVRAGWGGESKWPNNFMLETSVDGKVWEKVLDVTDAKFTRATHWYAADTTDYDAYQLLPSDGKDATLLNQREFCRQPLPIRGYGPSSAGLASDVNVQVDAGATLDLSHVMTAASGISSITIDAAVGGGTIKGMSAGANGVLKLENSDLAKLDASHVFDLDLVDVKDGSQFGTWKVYLNGTEVCGYKLAYSNGVLSLRATGTMLIFR